MMRKPFAATLTLALAVLFAAGCSDQGPTAPDSGGLEPSFTRATTVTGYISALDPALLVWFNAEKARVAAQAVTQEASYLAQVSAAGSYDKWARTTARNGVAQCYPNQYAADVQIIGPAGGELKVGPTPSRCRPTPCRSTM